MFWKKSTVHCLGGDNWYLLRGFNRKPYGDRCSSSFDQEMERLIMRMRTKFTDDMKIRGKEEKIFLKPGSDAMLGGFHLKLLQNPSKRGSMTGLLMWFDWWKNDDNFPIIATTTTKPVSHLVRAGYRNLRVKNLPNKQLKSIRVPGRKMGSISWGTQVATPKLPLVRHLSKSPPLFPDSHVLRQPLHISLAIPTAVCSLAAQCPRMHVQEQAVPMAFPAYLYQAGGGSMENGATSSSGGGLPGHFSTNGYTSQVLPPSFPVPPPELQNQRILNCRAARSVRRIARQRNARLRRPIYPANSLSSSTTMEASSTSYNIYNEQGHLYTYCTPYNKKLRVLLKKVLKNSDVSNGRIILPKRDAEENLPTLLFKSGIPIVMRDIHTNQDWGMKYRYWSNNWGRMYLLDHVRDFVRENGLETGDSLTLYEDENRMLYFSITKAERPAPNPSEEQNNAHNNQNQNANPFLTEHEEDSSFQLLVEELRHREQVEAISLMTLYPDRPSPS